MPKKKSKEKAPDFSPKLPDHVAKQGEKADALLAQETEPVDPAKEPVVAPAKLEPTNPEPVVAKPVEPKPTEPQDLQHKYDVLQGKYNKEIGDLRQGIDNLNLVVQQQNSLIEQLQAAPQAQPTSQSAAEPATPAEPAVKKLDPTDFASYGDEIVYLVEGFNKLIEQNEMLVTQAQNAGSAAGGDGRLERVEKMVHETASDRYMSQLDKNLPSWRVVNDSAEFKAWLATIDGVTGYRYNDVMRFAANNLKHGQVISLFKRYGAEKNIDLGQATPEIPDLVTSIQRDNGVIDETVVDPLASQLMPGDSTGGSDSGGGGSDEQAPTREEVAKASALYAKGKIAIEDFTKISDRFQKAEAAKDKQQNG